MALEDVVESLKSFDMDQLNDLNNVGSWPLAVKLIMWVLAFVGALACLLYTSPSPRDQRGSRMPSSA